MWILLSFFLTTSSYSAFVALDNSALNQLKTKCEKGSKEACTKFFNNSPLRTFDYWKNNLTKQSVPIFEAPDALLEYLKLDNKNNGYN